MKLELCRVSLWRAGKYLTGCKQYEIDEKRLHHMSSPVYLGDGLYWPGMSTQKDELN